MTIAFNHSYELSIGRPGRLLVRHLPANAFNTEDPILSPSKRSILTLEDPISGGYIDYVQVPSDAVLITDLQMTARLEYSKGTTGGKPQPGIIELYNAPPGVRARIIADNSVILKAGYLSDRVLPVIYVGQIVKVRTKRVGQDRVTTIYLSDAANIRKNVKYANKFSKNTPYSTVLTDIANFYGRNGTPLGRFVASDRTSVNLQRSLPLQGRINDVLDEVTRSISYTWFISGGKLYIQPKEFDRPTEVVQVFLDGIKGDIDLLDDKSGVLSNSAANTPPGVALTVFLNGNITLDKLLSIREGEFTGDYSISSLLFSLDFRGDSWHIDIEAQGVNNT